MCMTNLREPRIRTKEQLKEIAIDYLNQNTLLSIAERSHISYRTLKSWKAKGFYLQDFDRLQALIGSRVFVLLKGRVVPVRVQSSSFLF